MYLAALFHPSHELLNVFVSCSTDPAVVAFLDQLRQDLCSLQRHSLAPSTQQAYKTHLQSYQKFCDSTGLRLVPCNADQMCVYIMYLSRSLSYSSIVKYIGIIRILHLECGLPDPSLLSDYHVKRTLQAVKRLKGSDPIRKQPVTPEPLSDFYKVLDMGSLDDATFWAVCLVAFFGLLKISNVIPKSRKSFDPSKHLTRGCFTSVDDGILLKLCWAKNNQFKERINKVPLPFVAGHSLCPVTAVYCSFFMPQGWSDDAPAFVRGKQGNLTPVLYGWFMNKLKVVLQSCGKDPKLFGSHSLRRGGASWALRCGLGSDTIRILGDWKSNAYQAYLEIPLSGRMALVRQLADQVVAQVD